jgi:hypothetical protein
MSATSFRSGLSTTSNITAESCIATVKSLRSSTTVEIIPCGDGIIQATGADGSRAPGNPGPIRERAWLVRLSPIPDDD